MGDLGVNRDRVSSYQGRPRQASAFSGQISHVLNMIDRIDDNISLIAQMHEKALHGVSQDETDRINRRLDALQDETSDMMDDCRNNLKKASDETKRMGNSSESKSRKAQQSSAAKRLQKAAQRYGKVQKQAKENHKKRIEREIKIARPDMSQRDIERAVNDGDSGFAQQMLSSRSQRRILEEVENRHEEMRRMEHSIEELATMFMDLQVLLETQQEQIDMIETNVDYTAAHVEDGGKEIKRAISIRKSSRRKMWYIVALVAVIIIVVAFIVYLQRCTLGFCSEESSP